MASDIDLGNRIRDSRIARGLSQADLARQLEISTSAVWNWEQNGAQPRPAMLNALAAALNVPEPYLRTGRQDEAPPRRTAVQIIYAARQEIAEINGVEVDRVLIDWRVEG